MKALNKKHKVQHLILAIIMGLGLAVSTALATDTVLDTASFYRVHQSTFGTEWFQYDDTSDLIELTDGSYVAAGRVFEHYNHAYGVRSNIIKYNKNGAIHWNKAFGSTEAVGNFAFHKIIELNNGDLLALGDTTEDTGVALSGSGAMFAVRLDSLGNIKWQKVYGRSSALKTYITPLGATEDINGNLIIIARYTNAWNDIDLGYSIFTELTLDESGNLLSHALITDDTDSALSNASGRVMIEKTADGGYLVVAKYFFSGFSWTSVVTKLDALGNKEWGHYLVPKDSNGDSAATDNLITIELDDGYILVSTANIDKVNFTSSVFVYKVDLLGNLVWNKSISGITLNGNITGSNSSWNVYRTPANEVLISVTNGFSSIDFTVVNINPENGDVKWVKSYGSKSSFERESGGDKPFRMLPIQEGHIVGAGANFLIKIPANGEVPFDSDDFTAQMRTGYSVQVTEVDKVDVGFWQKFVPDFSITEKPVNYFLPGTAVDLSVVTEAPVGIVSPADFSFILDADILTLQWGAIEDATGYMLFWGSQSGNYADSMDMGNILQLGPFDVSGLPRGSYYLAVEAYNEADTSTPSNEILVNLVDPAGPPNFRYTLDADILTLQWDEVENAAGYKLFWGGQAANYSDSMDMEHIPQLGPFDVSGLPRGRYYLAVTFYDANGESRFSNEIVVSLKSPGDPQERSVDNYVDLVMGLSNDTVSSGLTDQLEPILLAVTGEESSSCPMVDKNFDLSNTEELEDFNALLQTLPDPIIINTDYGTGCTTDTGDLMAGISTITVENLNIDENTSNLNAIFSMQVNNLSQNGVIIGNGVMSGSISANIENSTATGHLGLTDFLISNGLQVSGGIDYETLENSDISLDINIVTDSDINAQLALMITSAAEGDESDSYTINTKTPGTVDQYTVSLDSVFYNTELCEAYPIAGTVTFSSADTIQTVRFDDSCDGSYILE